MMASVARFDAPAPFNFQQPEDWPAWKRRFERFRVAAKLSDETEEVQVSTLLYVMGPEADTAFDQLGLTAANQKKWKNVIEGFDRQFTPATNTIHWRSVLHGRYQKPGENYETYVRTLFEITDKCGYEDRNIAVRDQFVVGISDSKLRKELQRMADLTLDKALVRARQEEQLISQVAMQSQSQSHSSNVDAVGAGRRPTPGYRNHKKTPASHHQRSSNVNMNKCGNCGHGHGNSEQCPAMGKKCYRCGGMNHYKKLCRSAKQTRKPPQRNFRSTHELSAQYVDTAVDDDDPFFLGEIKCDNVPAWTVQLKIAESVVLFKIDSGADVTVITENTYQSLKQPPKLSKASRKLRGVGGLLTVIGMFEVQVMYKGEVYKFDVYVVQGRNNLLSRAAATTMGLLTAHISEVNDQVFGDMGLVNTKPIVITPRENVTPYHVGAPRTVPIPLRPKTEKELYRALNLGVIRRITKATDWCAPISVTLKKNGKLRLCVDLRKLNKSLKRESLELPTMEDIAPTFKDSECYSLLDASNSFWQMPLDAKSQELTTFITHIGRFCFTRLPFGITIASEIFQRKMHEILDGVEGIAIYQDDIIVHGKSTAEHDMRLQLALKKIEKSGLKLNKSKCIFGVPKIKFLGHIISKEGISPDPEKVRAIRELPPLTPETVKPVIGMINFLGQYIPNLQTVMKPLNALMKSDSEFVWGPEQQKSFDEVKDLLTAAPCLACYDPNKPTVVSCDASSYGLGGALLQEQNGDKKDLRPVAFCSRTLTETERGYAQIEKECLACAWVCEKFTKYLMGLGEFQLYTDHKPLIPLIETKDLHRAPSRVQRLLMRLMAFNIKPVYVPGKQLVIADALSRAPVGVPGPEVQELVDDIESYCQVTRSQWPASTQMLDNIREATSQDAVLMAVMKQTLSGWPRYAKDVDIGIREYFSVNAHLSVMDGLLLYDDRIVIPPALRAEVLQKIHAGHMGITKCKTRASQSVWWFGIGNDIVNIVKSCEFCQTHQPTQRKEPLMPTALPEGPWEYVAADLFQSENGNYLAACDYYSRYLEICKLNNKSSGTVIQRLKSIFARWGIPERVFSDNGPEFASSLFAQFAHEYGFQHVTSSPHYHQSNGEAESHVKIAKKIVEQKDPHLSLLIHNTTPVASTKYSPAELMMGRKLRTNLPILKKNLKPEWPDPRLVIQNDQTYKAKSADHYNQRHGVRELPTLKPGDHVRMKLDNEDKWGKHAVTVRQDDAPRSYIVQSDDGGMYRRNRKNLLYVPPPQVPVTPPDPVTQPIPSQSLIKPVTQSPVTQPGPTPQSVPTPSVLTPSVPAPNMSTPMVPAQPRRSLRESRPPSRLIQEM